MFNDSNSVPARHFLSKAVYTALRFQSDVECCLAAWENNGGTHSHGVRLSVMLVGGGYLRCD